MRTDLCDAFGITYPIFAFTHARGVAAEASRNGGFGVLGAVGLDADQLEEALTWIDAHNGGHPYGVDFLIPARSEDTGSRDNAALVTELERKIPDGHRRFAREVLAEHGVAMRDPGAPPPIAPNVQTSLASVYPMLEVALAHPGVTLIVNALGPPPKDVLDTVHATGRKVAALVGKARHAELNVELGVDLIVAQGTEAGGHTGEIATMVLTPEIVEVASPTPVLTAGGIASGRQFAAALALGAQGVWVGSAWLTTSEVHSPEITIERLIAATSSDTVRSRSMTGKPVRQLRSVWSDAWSAPGAPSPLDMPLQQLLVADLLDDGSPGLQELGISGPLVGQVVGQLRGRPTTREVLLGMVSEFNTVAGELAAIAERPDEPR